MNIFGVGLPEVTVILIIALLIFGPKKLPELGKQLGKTLQSLKKASNEFQDELNKAVNVDDNNALEEINENVTEKTNKESDKK
tara:strand:- start:449 stop:697 length:249 start_codon:yes stop_codon:yes gene_type:complete